MSGSGPVPAALTPAERVQAAVALGRRALAVLLAQEWNGGDVAGNAICPECGADKYQPDPARPNLSRIDNENPKHLPGCEWGAVCDETRRLASGVV